MDNIKIEEVMLENVQAQELNELTDLQLALIGGGIGETTL